MSEESRTPDENSSSARSIHVAPSPHVSFRGFTTRRMMIDVIIGLIPILAMSVYVFKWYAAIQLGICVVSCVVAETIFTAIRRKPIPVSDFSAVVTGMILAFSIPATSPWYVGVLGGFVAIGLGKTIFGGLGMNIFNPAMVGRAFVMIAFTSALAAGGYVNPESSVEAITQATPLTQLKDGQSFELMRLVIGNTNGSLGETSAIACLLGGLYLCIRRTAAWQIPFGALLAVTIIAGLHELLGSPNLTTLQHLAGGALLFGTFFIMTDPVSSALTPKGRFIMGLGFGALVMLMRTLSAYPEGVMFSVLLMNAVTPLINRWTIPKPVGGPVPVKVKKS